MAKVSSEAARRWSAPCISVWREIRSTTGERSSRVFSSGSRSSAGVACSDSPPATGSAPTVPGEARPSEGASSSGDAGLSKASKVSAVLFGRYCDLWEPELLILELKCSPGGAFRAEPRDAAVCELLEDHLVGEFGPADLTVIIGQKTVLGISHFRRLPPVGAQPPGEWGFESPGSISTPCDRVPAGTRAVRPRCAAARQTRHARLFGP